MVGHGSLLAQDFLSAAKISSNFRHHQIFSAGYSSRLYMYIGIYNRYSDYRLLNRSAKIIPPRRTFQIISANVRECPFWFRSFPRNVRMNGSFSTKYAYNPPKLWVLTHFWRIITKFSQIFCPLFCPLLVAEICNYQSITIANLVGVR